MVAEKIMNAEEPESLKDVSGRIFDGFKQGSQDIYTVRNPFEDLLKEEDEASESEKDLSRAGTDPTDSFMSSRIMVECMQLIQELLMELQPGQSPQAPMVTMPELTVNIALDELNIENFPALWRARAKLTVKGCDPKLDVVFISQITMSGVLNLYLDPSSHLNGRMPH